MNADGTNQRQLSENGWNPVWSPDSARIAYTRGIWEVNEEGGRSYINRIWLMNADGTNQRQLSDYSTNAVWSPDGTRIAYTETNDSGIWLANADGTIQRRLTDYGSNPVWSPSGAKIAFHRGGIWLMDADGTNQRQLTTKGWNPVWSPDNTKIAYTNGAWQDNTEDGGSDFRGGIWLVYADGSNLRQLTDDLTAELSHHGSGPIWSPDSDRIAYTRVILERETIAPQAHRIRQAASEIVVMSADGTNQQQLTETGWNPVWSPDNTKIAFSIDEHISYYRVWLIEEDGTNQQHLTDIGGYPVWSPDNTKIAYTDGDGNGIWLTSADGTNQQQLTANGQDPAWSPDSTKIAYTDSDGNGIWLMNADGTNQQQLTPIGWEPVWSSDSASIAYTRGFWHYYDEDSHYGYVGGIWLMNADGTNQRQITANLGTGDTGRYWLPELGATGPGPAWSPDNTRVAYTDGHVSVGWSVWLTNGDGTNQRQLTDSGREPVWSPDSTKIVYDHSRARGIWLMDADGTNHQQLTDNGECPAWSPDSTKVAFDHGGIWLMNADGTNQRPITDDGECPTWVSLARSGSG